MGRKCYISFKMEDEAYKTSIQNMDIDMVDKSLDSPINSVDEDYIINKIRKDLSDSTVTIHLIGTCSAENSPGQDQTYIKRELQLSLFNSEKNTRSGILGVVLPDMYTRIYSGIVKCQDCNRSINSLNLNNDTTIKEFSYNFHIPNNKCHWDEEDRYCTLVKWIDFINDPEKYIEQAFRKRTHPIANKIKVYPN